MRVCLINSLIIILYIGFVVNLAYIFCGRFFLLLLFDSYFIFIILKPSGFSLLELELEYLRLLFLRPRPYYFYELLVLIKYI